MRNPTIVIAAVSALCACGGSGGGANGRAFDQMIAGIWNGTSTLEVQGIEPIVYSSSLKIEVSGSTGNISNVCPDGTGAFPLEGSGSSAQWANRTVTCPLGRFAGCNRSAYFDYHAGRLSLSPDSTLHVDGSGLSLGCAGGIVASAAVTFVGTKE